ncbi:MAG TPA: hypothetical protein VGH92_05525 [Gaiellaceae bacterium]
MICRIVIWSLAESMTTLDELRVHLPELEEDGRWISNEPAERLGLIVFDDDLPDLTGIQALIGVDPVIFEEYDVE